MRSNEENGVGITEEDVKNLFKIEEKVSTFGTDGETSAGLGLLLYKEFIDMHREKIWAYSKENVGSIFSFTLQGEDGHEIQKQER
ncbi:MAG: ATP-binding protein [Melioribacteraceae bacterium]|nr:ATP-binding protein [Melioribacteraceae bacterium]